MTQHEDESLEDCVEQFHYNVQRVRQGDLAPETQRVFLLRGIRDECIELLNMMSGGDVSQLQYDTIVNLFVDIPEVHQRQAEDQETS
jgi:hypothetical protein